ncbi:MAG TPA: DUF3037 domain-containing protein [Actinocrinis sp.]|jgi:hypothetical protein|uniref:DUF3037 domain-containing protein n=1 Tax=Actinocrinis sp. TaxID=1920516 RepID=UPI002DDD87DB|nr:DUF3037 domain-containing protein [Actinocrinis sp.]HEV3169489.1 DUF3037 domain-containing protein [Actinocrinis sp.]
MSASVAAPVPDAPAERYGFEYAPLHAVPRVDRGDAVNVGVIVYCQKLDFLAASTRVDPDRLLALDPEADVAGIEAAVAAYACVCRGGSGAGAAGAGSAGQRFRWLTAPRSTVVQPGPVHLGLTADPAAELARLVGALIP